MAGEVDRVVRGELGADPVPGGREGGAAGLCAGRAEIPAGRALPGAHLGVAHGVRGGPDRLVQVGGVAVPEEAGPQDGRPVQVGDRSVAAAPVVTQPEPGEADAAPQ